MIWKLAISRWDRQVNDLGNVQAELLKPIKHVFQVQHLYLDVIQFICLSDYILNQALLATLNLYCNSIFSLNNALKFN